MSFNNWYIISADFFLIYIMNRVLVVVFYKCSLILEDRLEKHTQKSVDWRNRVKQMGELGEMGKRMQGILQ